MVEGRRGRGPVLAKPLAPEGHSPFQVFSFYKQEALARGFSHVASGPLVRSSYMAEVATATADFKLRKKGRQNELISEQI